MVFDEKEFSRSLPRKRCAAGALFTNTQGEIMLVVPTYKTEWEIPGGTVEENESPKEACIREVKEELDIGVPIGDLLRLDYRAENETATELLIFLFDGGVLDEHTIARIALPEDELSDFKFVTVDAAKEVLIPALFELVESGLMQRSSPNSPYTEYSTAVS